MKQKIKELEVVRDPHEEYEQIERRIIELFRKEIYLPIIKEFQTNKPILRNAIDDLYQAIRIGQITFNQGIFSGKFNAAISRELKKLGAKKDKHGAWRINKMELPIDVRNAISGSYLRFQEKIAGIDQRLGSILPEQLADKLKTEKLFDTAIYRTNARLNRTLEAITVEPILTPERRKQIAAEWQNNMKLWIKDFTEKEIKTLRKSMQASVFAGNRFETAVQTIQKSYGVTERKAKFLARQETMLLTTKFKEIRYKEAGISKYRWKSVKGSHLHPVRPMHQDLNNRSDKGELFDFQNPPVDDPNGSRHNPGQNYNCRCTAIPVVIFNK